MTGIIYKVKLILSLPLQISFIDSDIKKIATNLIKINIFMLHCVEVSSPKTINITQYLNTNNFSVNSRHFVMKSSQTTQLYITKVF
jgi:hypothetical protein